MAKAGRPSKYTQELIEEICKTVASASKSLKQLCKENCHWPLPDTIIRWRNENQEFSNLYARAKQQQVEAHIEEILEIINDTSRDFHENEDGKVVANLDHINRTRLKVDTLKWFAAKLCPRLYGDKTVITGADGKELLVQLNNDNNG